MKQLSADILSASAQQAKKQNQQLRHQKQLEELEENRKLEEENTRSLGHCHQLAEQLAHDYNKSVVFWPCPHMRVSTVHGFHFSHPENLDINLTKVTYFA